MNQVSEAIQYALGAGVVPFIKGSPGIGKSAAIHDIARKFGLRVIDLRLAQCEPTDLLGFPNISDGVARYTPMSVFPVAVPENPKANSPGAGYNGWLLFLDEFNSADRDVQKAAYKLVLDRMVGEYHLRNDVYIVAAGNKDTDNAIVEEMSSALASRLTHLYTKVVNDEWYEWAMQNGINPMVIAFLKFKPVQLYTFKPEMDEADTYACPRTWEMASKLLNECPKALGVVEKALLEGTLGKGTATEFVTFLRLTDKLPKIEQLLKEPDHCDIPSDPGTLYALAGSLASNVNENNIEPVTKVATRLPLEYQITALTDIAKRKPEFFSHPALANWISTTGAKYFK